jgi:hypothetical protein
MIQKQGVKIVGGNMLSINPERAASCALFCKSIFTKPLIFESTLSVFSKLLRSCDLSASNGQHCGEYRVIYHKNNGDRFFLSFEAKYPNPEPKKGKAGCSIFTKPLIFESTSSVFSKLLRSCVLELCVVALPLLRIFVSVLTSENLLIYNRYN